MDKGTLKVRDAIVKLISDLVETIAVIGISWLSAEGFLECLFHVGVDRSLHITTVRSAASLMARRALLVMDRTGPVRYYRSSATKDGVSPSDVSPGDTNFVASLPSSENTPAKISDAVANLNMLLSKGQISNIAAIIENAREPLVER